MRARVKCCMGMMLSQRKRDGVRVRPPARFHAVDVVLATTDVHVHGLYAQCIVALHDGVEVVDAGTYGTARTQGSTK